MMRGRVIVLLGTLFLVSCGGDDPTESEEYAALSAELSEVEAERDSAMAERDEIAAERGELAADVDELDATSASLIAEGDALQGDLEAAETERNEAIAERDTAIGERGAALAERDDAIAAADELRQLYDPQINAAIAAVQQTAIDAACAAGDRAGYDGAQPPAVDEIITNAARELPAAEREAAIDRVDRGPVRAKLVECRAAGETRKAAEALTAPHGDGLWTVGVEIAPGLWRSTGTADDCYWQRSPDGHPDDIIDNHFGTAGGSVTLNPGEEFETDRCGAWEFVG